MRAIRVHKAHGAAVPPRIHVVIVDDDGNDCRGLIAFLLREEGFEVAKFDSGAEGLSYAESSTRPVVLFLGGLRHFLALEARIECRSPTKNLRILLATGAPSWRIPRHTSVIILKKPMDADEMFAAIVGASLWSPPAAPPLAA